MHLKKYAYPLLQLVRPTMAQGSSSEYLLTAWAFLDPFITLLYLLFVSRRSDKKRTPNLPSIYAAIIVR